MSVFPDPKTFASMTFTGANSTESTPVPAGEWPAEVAKFEIVPWQSKQDTSKAGLKLALQWKVSDPAVEAVTGRKDNIVRHDIMLDLTPEGGLDMGKGMNVQLGRLRTALGLNVDGMAWSFDMFVGRSATILVKHREYEGKLFAEVSGVVTVG